MIDSKGNELKAGDRVAIAQVQYAHHAFHGCEGKVHGKGGRLGSNANDILVHVDGRPAKSVDGTVPFTEQELTKL